MMRLRTLCALSLSLCVMACAHSSPSSLQPSQALTSAAAKLDQALDHPAPPAQLLGCQDSSMPQVIKGKYECPPPPDVLASLATDSLQDQVATLIGALRIETDLRFQLLNWDYGAASKPVSTPPPH